MKTTFMTQTWRLLVSLQRIACYGINYDYSPWAQRPGAEFLGSRPMAGRQTLDLLIGVRILSPQ